MGTQIKNNSGAGPVRILIVSQTYSYLGGLENIEMNVKEIRDLYARRIDRYREEFGNKIKINEFFTVQNRDFKDLRDFISSGEYDIIHFSLHAHKGIVYFTEKDHISYDDFVSAFNDIKGKAKVVILNFCNSAEIAKKISGKIPWVLGWDYNVPALKTASATNSFYSSLFYGNPVPVCFRRLSAEPGIIIYKDSVQFDNIKESEILPDDTTIHCSENHIEVDPDQKKSKKRILPALIILFALILLVFFMKNRKPFCGSCEIDSLQIISHKSGANVVQGNDFVISAKLRHGGIPWIFVLPPSGTEWWPQYEGHLTGNGNWEVPVQIGNEVDSGQFTVIAMVIKDHIADEMKAWLASQGTINQSDPLRSEILESFFWYAADTVVVTRVIE